jgi:hypothetical protein
VNAEALLDLAGRLEVATADELEALGWEAARWLLNANIEDCLIVEAAGGNPSLSLDACKRLHERVLPGWEYQILTGRPLALLTKWAGGALRRHQGLALTIPAAWLAAMCRAKAGSET